MKDLERILGQRRTELARALRRRPGLAGDRAERFVAEASHDLVESYRWQAEDLDEHNLSAPRNVQNLLRGMRGSGIANRLGLPQEAVWDGLRAFVPLALRMAERSGPPRSDGTGPGSSGDPKTGLLGLAGQHVGYPASPPSWRSGWRGPSRIVWPPSPSGMLFPSRCGLRCEPPAA